MRLFDLLICNHKLGYFKGHSAKSDYIVPLDDTLHLGHELEHSPAVFLDYQVWESFELFVRVRLLYVVVVAMVHNVDESVVFCLSHPLVLLG